MLRRVILTFALALLFALGQQGAMVHEISHYADLAPLSQQQDKAPHSPVCDKCLVYGELAHALSVSHFTPLLPATAYEHVQYTAAQQFDLPLYAYSARAPPVLA
ncbi:MAG: hypothetical protein ABI475_04470 [Methylophilaceae bacterium]